MTKRILLVEDERSIRESLSKILRGGDYEVLVAENGLQAIEKHGADRIDLLLLDINLPIKDGWDVLQWLAEVNPLLPIVIITARSDQRAVAEAAGADILMEKPLDVPVLLQSIRDLLNEPIESRAQHASSHAASFRYVPCDHPIFHEMRFKRFTIPIPGPGAKTL
ncbi:MAG: response regulator [Verrucomicrobia bacterium]|nr:response regulator [Verrucomicrobiota bacterium]